MTSRWRSEKCPHFEALVSVASGEILAVMGPSDSGKSTLLHCLAGILTPESGEIRSQGRRVDTMGEEERSTLRRDHFGFVFQFGQLVPELSAEENVALRLLLGGAAERKRWTPLERGSSDLASAAWSSGGPGNCPGDKPNACPRSRSGRPARGAVRR